MGGFPALAPPGEMSPNEVFGWVIVTPGVDVVTVALTPVASAAPLLARVTRMLTLSPGSGEPLPLLGPPSEQVSCPSQDCTVRLGALAQRRQLTGITTLQLSLNVPWSDRIAMSITIVVP